jgi:hypothetical protein
MMTTTGFRSPPDKALNCRNPPNTFPTQKNKVLAYRVTTWMKNKELVCYPNLDQILAGLSICTQKNLTILLYGVTKE